MKDLEGVEHLDDRCEKGEQMDNPIPSAMVYFDEKQKRAVLCLDKGIPPNMEEACNKNGAFHSHSWVPLGWVSETTFMTERRRFKGLAMAFVEDLMRSVISIRDSFDRMQHERNEVRKINTKLSGIIRNLTSVLNNAVPYIESEKVRLKMFKAISQAQSHVLTKEDGDPQ